MKVIFSFHRWAAAAVLFGGCVELTVEPPTGFVGEGLPAEIDVCPGCSSEQVIRGEAILLVNAKLSGPRSNFTANFAIDGEGRYVGAGLYLYDPRRECEGGGAGCRLARIGHLWLDESLGALSVGDGSLERFGVRDLAWHPQRGLWGLSYDALNDEWGLVSLTVPDWRRTDNQVAVERFTFMPGPVSDPATDACYWRQMLSGLGFVGDALVVGSAGKAGNGFDARGGVFSIPSSFLEAPSHCVFPNDRTLDPQYYACTALCAEVALFDDRVGVAGDITEDPQGRLLAAVRAEDPAIMPVDRNSLFNIDMAAPGAGPTSTGVVIDGLLAGRDIDGLARVDGVLYGIDPLGLVYRVIEPTPEQPDVWSVVVHDDLSPLFEDPIESLRLRGATRVVVEQ